MSDMTKQFLILLLAMLVASCEKSQDSSENMETKEITINDPHSFSRPEESRVFALHWEADVDFEEKVIKATATLQLENSEDADTLILDTQKLQILSINYLDGTPAEYTLGDEVPFLGQPLRIAINTETEGVTIEYITSPEAGALQWLNPQQTSGKNSPFLFTQSQAILARSWIPIQDSPGIRFTYSALVRVPPGQMALMSAENPQEKSENGEYTFSMPQPIPAYLLALAVGDLTFESLGPRSGVYAEPSVIEAAAYEFAEIENMIVAAEELYGPYQWGRYDLLVLPPSFPFGGMENPRLTFATPTILAGDRSLTSLVAHELAHSWSGNLVTNASWNDFWLNEGFTVYFEQRIMEKLFGREYSEMLASLEVQNLRDEVTQMLNEGKEKDTHLKLDLAGRDPDEGMTNIAYQKGYLFLRYLEEKAGREAFDIFLENYFERNAFEVMTTEEFITQVNEYLIVPSRLNIGKVKLNEWINGPGIPEDAVLPVSDRFTKVDEEREKFLNEMEPEKMATENWSSHEWVYFVRGLPSDMNNERMEVLDKEYDLTGTGNSEILTAWLTAAIQHEYEPAYSKLEEFLIQTGRRKFLMPLYTELIKTENGKTRALGIYSKARPNYHFIAVNSLDELLNYEATN